MYKLPCIVKTQAFSDKCSINSSTVKHLIFKISLALSSENICRIFVNREILVTFPRRPIVAKAAVIAYNIDVVDTNITFEFLKQRKTIGSMCAKKLTVNGPSDRLKGTVPSPEQV